MNKRQALERAIKVLGGRTPFASALVVSSQRVDYWVSKGYCPEPFCPTIERLTRAKGKPVVCEELAPNVEWAVLREQVAEE